MGLLDSLKSLFFGGETRPPPARRLDGRSKLLLSASLERLPIEEPGWITMQEANALFSPMETADCIRFRGDGRGRQGQSCGLRCGGKTMPLRVHASRKEIVFHAQGEYEREG
jgi:hypothetical protein